MHWLLAGYMWLFIHRPFEVWPWLGELRIERVYMLITLGAWLLVANKGWTSNRINVAVAALYGAILVSWVLSPFQVQATTTVEDFAKIGVFYVLLMSCIRDERTLRFILMAFLVCTALYMAHSLRVYQWAVCLPHGHRPHDRCRCDARRSQFFCRVNPVRPADHHSVLAHGSKTLGVLGAGWIHRPDHCLRAADRFANGIHGAGGCGGIAADVVSLPLATAGCGGITCANGMGGFARRPTNEISYAL